MGICASGLAEILAATGVSVEMPPPIGQPNDSQRGGNTSSTETVVLRGYPESLGRAISMVYERAESSVTEEIAVPCRFHPILIGKSGTGLEVIREGYEKVIA
ncbi:unnamed protein product [Protopolystoma xenopodis]|uniref:K Homology domain-containing protein n=1 Tax=Protopolystoma xenopodis TaxID=117903 RepID=A0A3S5AM93_9PLAT|nr:unnamed protein product [Protopolystoma xenopodis]